MSQAIQPEENTLESEYTDFLDAEEVYAVKANDYDDLRTLQAYALENPDTTFLVDFQFEGVMRGANEQSDNLGNYIEENNLIGGGSEPIDENSYGIINSDICYQNFREQIYGRFLRAQFHSNSESDLIMPIRENGEPAKDMFAVSEHEIDEYPKAVRTAARVGEGPTTPNLYGAVWREETNETLKPIFEEEEEVTVGWEEFDQYAHTFENEFAETLWNDLTDNAEQVEIGELLEEETLDPNQYDRKDEDKREPLNCAAEIGRDTTNKRTPNYPVGELELR